MYHPQITPDMIERAARAIRMQACARSTGLTPRPFEQLPATLQASYRAEAKAALLAALNEG